MKMFTAVVCVVGIMSAPVLAQKKDAPRHVVTEQEARTIAKQAASSTSAGNQKAFEKAFRNGMRTLVPDYEGGGSSLFGFGVIRVFSRLEAFQEVASEQVRTLKPVEDAAWPSDDVIVMISPRMMNDPVVDRMVISRNGRIIEPTASDIRETEAKNLTGAVFKTREGWAAFPIEAFAEEKNLKLNLMVIPISGNNLTPKIDSIAMWHAHSGNK